MSEAEWTEFLNIDPVELPEASRNDDRAAAAHNGGLSVKQVRQPTTRRTDGHGPVGETG
jgi:hypothetical protein